MPEIVISPVDAAVHDCDEDTLTVDPPTVQFIDTELTTNPIHAWAA